MFTKISQISQENTGVGDFFNKVASLLVSLSNKVKDFLACNVIKKRLQHRCFPVKFEKCLRTPTFKNLYGQLLLNIIILQQICIVFIFGSITIVCVYIYILYIYIYIWRQNIPDFDFICLGGQTSQGSNFFDCLSSNVFIWLWRHRPT